MDGCVGRVEGDSKECDKSIPYKILNTIFKKIKSEKNDSKRERLQARDFWENGRLQ